MKKIKIIYIVISLFFTGQLFANGNMDNYELGTAIYRDLNNPPGSGQHYHTAMFLYFEYLSNGNGKMQFTQMNGGAWDYVAGYENSQTHTKEV